MDKNLYDQNNWQGFSSIYTNSKASYHWCSIKKFKQLNPVIQ